MNTLSDLFHHQLKDLHSAEIQLTDALPFMKGNASNSKLHQALADHLEETKQHKERLDEIAGSLGVDLSGEICNAMKGLIKEAKVTHDDLRAKLREANVTKLSQVQAVVMETTGDVSVLHHDDANHELDAVLLKDVRGGRDSAAGYISERTSRLVLASSHS